MKNLIQGDAIQEKFKTTCGHEECQRANEFGLKILETAFSEFPKMRLVDLVSTLTDAAEAIVGESIKLGLKPERTLEEADVSAQVQQPVGGRH